MSHCILFSMFIQLLIVINSDITYTNCIIITKALVSHLIILYTMHIVGMPGVSDSRTKALRLS